MFPSTTTLEFHDFHGQHQFAQEGNKEMTYRQILKPSFPSSFVPVWFVRWWLFLGLMNGLVFADPPSPMFLGTGPAGSTAGYAPDDERSRLTASYDVVTPHLSWGRPWAAGPLRVLAIAHNEAGRWPVELAQRFDFQVTTVYTYSRGELGGGGHGSQGRVNQRAVDVVARLLQAMNRQLDVIINDVPLATLGPKVQARMLELIERGVGYVGPTTGLELGNRHRDADAEQAMIHAAVPLNALKIIHPNFESLNAATMLQLWEADPAARIADVSGFVWDESQADPARLQYPWLVDMPWEAWCSLTARVALWAAGQVSAPLVADVNWPGEVLQRDDMPFQLPVRIKTNHRFNLRVWDADGQLRHRGTNTLLPRLPVGFYFVGLQCRSDHGIVDWNFGSIRVASSRYIESIALDSQHKRLDDQLTAVITVAGDLQPGTNLQLEVIDNFGRSVFVHNVSASNEFTLTADLGESLHIYNYVQAKLIDPNGDLLHEARQAFYIRQPNLPRDDLITMFWDPQGRFPSTRITMNRLVDLGMQAGLNGASLAMYAANVRPVRWNYTLRVSADKQGHVSPDIASPQYIDQIGNRMRQTAREFQPYSPLFYYVGDDVKYLGYGEDGGWNPHQLTSLASWAERTYGGLEQINHAWQTEYSELERIEPVKQAEALVAVRNDEAPRYGPLCHWVDHQLHTDEMFINFYRQVGQPIGEIDPDTPSNAGTSVKGWPHPGCGVDFWKLAENQKLAIQYPNPWVHDTFRSALTPNALHGVWYGGYAWYNYPPFYLDHDFLPWWSVFRGINVHALYTASMSSSGQANNGLVAADFSSFPGFRKIAAHHQELKKGLAKLLFNSKRVTDDVAILYSPASLHLSAVFDKGLPKLPEWKTQMTGSDLFIYMQCREGLALMFSDLGLSYDVVPTSLLSSDQFFDRGFRVLVLPLNLRLTAAEANTIRKFVQTGGVVVADVFAGLFDEYCQADHPGVLADVFGVNFPGGIPGEQVRLATSTTQDGTELGRLVADGGIQMTTAKAHGKTASGTPIFTFNRYGNGSAIMLNFLARDYQIWRTAGTELAFRKELNGLLAEAGIESYPQVKCVMNFGEKGSYPVRVTEVHRYELEGGRYVGLLRHHKLRPDDNVHMADLRLKPVMIHFDQPWHVYEMRSGLYRGHTDVVEDLIYPAQAELYALLPYEVRDLDIEAQWDSAAIMVSGKVSVDEPVTHVFHVELSDPQGRVRGELTRNIVAPQGRFQERFFVGYNEQPQGWSISVRDVASGLDRAVTVKY